MPDVCINRYVIFAKVYCLYFCNHEYRFTFGSSYCLLQCYVYNISTKLNKCLHFLLKIIL